MAEITILLVGTEESPVVTSLLNVTDIEFDIICNNILDFELPPKVENASTVWHRIELRNALNLLDKEKFTISASLKNLLKENDMLDLTEEYLGITSHITQIDQNSKDLFVAYDLLSKQADIEGINLIPLVTSPKPLLAIKNKKSTPLRYYQLKTEMLDMEIPKSLEKKKLNPKELYITAKSDLQELKLSDPSFKSMNDSDLIVILPTDLVSLAVLVYADELEKQIKNIQTPLVFLWPFPSDYEPTKTELEILTQLGYGANIDDFAHELSFMTDYVIISKKEKEMVSSLREHGCHVLTSELFDEEGQTHENLLNTILSVGEMESRINGESEEETPVEEEPSDEVETADEPEKEDVEVEEQPISGKAISQLSESPEEAGIESIKENLNLPENQNKDDIEEVLEDLSQIESEDNQEIQDIETREEEDTDINTDTLADADPNSVFKTEEGEDWIDTVKRAIETSFGEHHLEAVEWLVAQSTNDSDQEVQIAEQAITAWVDSRSAPDRKLGAEIISRLAKTHQETYVQILQRQMLQSVREKHEDKRRQLVPLFHVMRDVDINLTEHLIRAITKDLGIIGGEDELAVIETAKLTLLQLVIQSRRLTRICVQELLVILDTRTGLGPEIWNVLTAFDAGSISIELVTNFSITKAEEIIRRSNLLRFTGSYYSTITKVIQAWKDGDKAGISATTGTILPEETLRKFDRLELARKLDKLKMVQLSTLAESLGKDVETVERLITELIVNDELKAELKLVDDKMYLVSEDAEKSGN